jgi:hypothetical protein
MTCALHGVESCPLCTDDADPPRRPPRPPRHIKDNMAVDAKGNVLPYSPEEVEQIMQKAIDKGNVMAAILKLPNGDLAVQVFGPPSRALLEILETATAAYKRTLKGH